MNYDKQNRWIVALGVVILLLINGCMTSGSGSHPPSDAELRDSLFEREWGVRVLQIRLSAEGYMLDFRYRVLDAGKAAPLFSREVKPYLIDEISGAMFLVPEPPKVGALRTTRPPQAGKNYFILFANPGQYIKKGSKVTVIIGDFKAEHLVVE
jgi:hypothetical protein